MKKMAWLLSLAFLSFTLGCQSAREKHYPLQAEVFSVDAPRKLIVVKHGAIPGLMPAMTMTYAVADARQIENLRPGDKISADLVVSENKGRLEKISLLNKAGGSDSHP